MKCQNCGKNEVTFIYRSSINGQVEEKRLCADCAEKLGYTQAVASQSRRMMQGLFGGGLFNDFFRPTPLLSGAFFEDPFEDFFTEMPALTAAPAQRTAPQVQEKPLVEEREQSRFARMRQLNALRLEQKAAVLREDFEKAAQLRDQIRDLERQKDAPSGTADAQ